MWSNQGVKNFSLFFVMDDKVIERNATRGLNRKFSLTIPRLVKTTLIIVCCVIDESS